MCRRRIRKRCATIVTYPAASLKPLFTDPPESSKVRQVEFDCHLDFQRLDLVLPDGCRAEAFRKQIESTLTIETHRRWPDRAGLRGPDLNCGLGPSTLSNIHSYPCRWAYVVGHPDGEYLQHNMSKHHGDRHTRNVAVIPRLHMPVLRTHEICWICGRSEPNPRSPRQSTQFP